MSKFAFNENAQPTGEHEVHETTVTRDCHPDTTNQVALGDHATATDAVNFAAKTWPAKRFDGCAYCAPSAHTR
jgi:hypothetical protein